MLATYGDITLCTIEDEGARDWAVPSGTSNLRVILPSDPVTNVQMASRGYVLGDRTLLCSISTRTLPDGFGKGARTKATMEQADHEAMFMLARRSFWGDRRFYITPGCDQEIAELVLREWIAGLDEVLVCRVKGEYAGFLALTEESDSALCVNLAATDERFRLVGVAMALYTEAVRRAHENGYARLVGRISSRNIAVMNLYAHLGAKFSDPLDVFLKEVR